MENINKLKSEFSIVVEYKDLVFYIVYLWLSIDI